MNFGMYAIVVYFHVFVHFLMFLHNWIYNIGFGVVECTSYLIPTWNLTSNLKLKNTFCNSFYWD
jgi:hypothetical protein